MQEFIVDKIHFFEFLSITDKARLGQLKNIFAIRNSSLSEFFHAHPWSTTSEKKPVLRTSAKSHKLHKKH